MKTKELPQEQWYVLAKLVLAEMSRLREFSIGRSSEMLEACNAEQGKLHTLYNYLIE